jgi:hypothetical protein
LCGVALLRLRDVPSGDYNLTEIFHPEGMKGNLVKWKIIDDLGVGRAHTAICVPFKAGG